jgi:Arc/MetJ family transcription regulator
MILHHDVGISMLLCMRTTIEISDELLRRAKRKAADTGVALRQIVEAALRSYLGGPVKGTAYRLRWRTERGRLQPGVNLDDRDHLFDLMDGRK